MIRKLTIALAVLTASAVASGGLAIVAPPTAGAAYTVKVESGLCYQTGRQACSDGANHQFDAYLPVGATLRTPGVILVHGGSFLGGDKSDLTSEGMKLAAAGMAAFSVNYRLDSATLVGFPMESDDVMAAIAYVRSHAGRFNVDPSRLASFGTSAGATLAIYSAMKAQQSDPAAQVSATVGWSGGYDFTVGTSGAVDPTQLRNVEWYLGCTDPTQPACAAIAHSASAISLVQPGDPPTQLANSTDYQVGCEIVDPAQAETMAARLQDAGDTVQLDLNDKCAHAQAYGSYEIPRTIAFLEAHLFVAPTIFSRTSKTFRIGTATNFTVKSKASPTATITELGSLPAGVSFIDNGDGTALISGTAQSGTEGAYSITLVATNGGQPSAVQSFTLSVVAARK
jgi:acetyl esterase/lipase